MLKRNAISAAVAMALGAMSMGANAGTLALGSGTITLATEMFGTGSQETLFTVDPALVTYTPTAGVGGVVFDADTDSVTIKFTLGGAAVFGEAVNTYDTMKAFLTLTATDFLAGVAGVAPTVSKIDPLGLDALATDLQWDVVAGGAIGDNTVTIVIQSSDVANGGAADSIRLATAKIGGFKIKNLNRALSNPNGKIQLGVEFASPGDVARVADTATDVVSDTAAPATIFDSQLAVDYTVTPAALPRINVGTNEKTFTATIPGTTDFNTPGTLNANLGTVQLSLVPLVMKEAGVPFDFQGGDKHTLTLTATGNAPLKAYDVAGGLDGVYLEIGGCTNNPDATLLGSQGTVNLAGDKVTFDLSGNSTANLTKVYNVCLRADNTDKLVETTIGSAWEIDYFNTRYIKDELTDKDFNPLLRNGCQVTLFNVPGIDNSADDAFIRLTNTSTNITGGLRVTIWDQAGTAVVTNKDVVDAVKEHATVVLTPEAGIANTTQLTDATGSGRYRVVLTGAFPSCEALGLVRNQSTGILVNMTATTSANDAGPGNNGN